MNYWVLAGVLFWVACWLTTAGIFTNELKRIAPSLANWGDILLGLVIGLGGPISLAIAFFMADRPIGWSLSYRVYRTSWEPVHGVSLPEFVEGRAEGRMRMIDGTVFEKRKVRIN